MKRFLQAIVGLIAVVSTACPPPVPVTDSLSLGPVGTWTSPAATISGTHFSSQFAGGSNAAFLVTATVAGSEAGRLNFRIESAATVPDIAVGTYTLQPFDPLHVMFIKTANDEFPQMSLDGSITITEVTYGLPMVGAGFTSRPIARLRATFSATFDPPAGAVNGSVSIG